MLEIKEEEKEQLNNENNKADILENAKNQIQQEQLKIDININNNNNEKKELNNNNSINEAKQDLILSTQENISSSSSEKIPQEIYQEQYQENYSEQNKENEEDLYAQQYLEYQEQLKQQEQEQEQKNSVIIEKPTFNIFVGDLRSDVVEDDLYQTFRPCGEIAKVHIFRDLYTGQQKGFGFVHFYEKEAQQKALKEYNGKVIKDRPCRVSLSEEKNTLFIGNVPTDMSQNDIKLSFLNILGEHCGLINIELKKGPPPMNESRGFCFAQFSNHLKADIARKILMNTQLRGKHLNVSWAESLKSGRDVDDEIMSHVKTLYVSNVPVTVTEQILQSIFGEVGPLKNCVIVKNPHTKQSRGFAFVEYVERKHAEEALKLDSFELAGVPLSVVLAKPPPPKPKTKSNSTSKKSSQKQQTPPPPQPSPIPMNMNMAMGMVAYPPQQGFTPMVTTYPQTTNYIQGGQSNQKNSRNKNKLNSSHSSKGKGGYGPQPKQQNQRYQPYSAPVIQPTTIPPNMNPYGIPYTQSPTMGIPYTPIPAQQGINQMYQTNPYVMYPNQSYIAPTPDAQTLQAQQLYYQQYYQQPYNYPY